MVYADLFKSYYTSSTSKFCSKVSKRRLIITIAIVSGRYEETPYSGEILWFQKADDIDVLRIKDNVNFIFDWLSNFGLYFSKKRLCHVMKSHIKTKKSSQIFKNKRMFIYIETFFSWKSLSFNIRFSFLLLQNKTEAYKDRQMWL